MNSLARLHSTAKHAMPPEGNEHLARALYASEELLKQLDDLVCARCLRSLGDEEIVTTTYDGEPPTADTDAADIVGVHARCA